MDHGLRSEVESRWSPGSPLRHPRPAHTQPQGQVLPPPSPQLAGRRFRRSRHPPQEGAQEQPGSWCWGAPGQALGFDHQQSPCHLDKEKTSGAAAT